MTGIQDDVVAIADNACTPAERLLQHFRENPAAGVTLELVIEPDWHGRETLDKVGIAWISRTGEKGDGARAMEALCIKADELDVVLELSVQPADRKGLVPYYRRFGFRKMPSDDDYYAMRRPSPSWKKDGRT